jgi:DNA-binding GntR family transcriptional regulator
MAIESSKAARVGPVKGYTLRELAFSELRSAILAGRFAPGEAITIRELADQMKLGIMPVREGVQQLASQGALEFLPNRSVRVPVHTLDELRKIFEARILLECYATEKAADTLTPAQIDKLRRTLDKLKDLPNISDAAKALENNFAFHFTIYEACGSPYIVDMIEKLWLRIGPLHLRVFHSTVTEKQAFFSVLPLHVELLDALAAHDGKAAGRIMGDLLVRSLAWYEQHAV